MQGLKDQAWEENPAGAMGYSMVGGMAPGGAVMKMLKPKGLVENLIVQGSLGAAEGAGGNEKDRTKGGLYGAGLGVAAPSAMSTVKGQ